MSLPDAPYRAPIFDDLKKVATVWLKWFDQLRRLLNQAPTVLGAVSLSGQSASIAATSISTPTLAAGKYQVVSMNRVTRADNVGSSLTPFVTVTESGLTVTYTGAANTSNNLNVGKSDTFNVLIDASTVVKYGTTYSTTGGAPAMQYRIYFSVHMVPEPT